MNQRGRPKGSFKNGSAPSTSVRKVDHAKYKAEIERCAKDPIYFIEKYCYVMHPFKGELPFKMFEFQKDLVKLFVDKNKKLQCIVKSRQLGVSTVYAALSLWLISFYQSKTVAIVATDLGVAQELHDKVLFMYDRLPYFLKKPTAKRNTKELKLKVTNSRVRAYAHNKKKGIRSLAATYVIMDEAAYIEGADELFATVQPALSTGGTCIALSSPNVPEGWFYEMYNKALDGDNDFYPVKLPWWLHPERQLKDGSPDEEWRERQDRNMGKRKAKMEYDAEFGFTDDMFFDPEYIEKIQDEDIREPLRKEGKLWVWEDPIPEQNYIVVVDVAEGGTGSDNHCVQVLKENNLEQVAEYLNNEHYTQFRPVPLTLAKKYNNATLIIEANSVGTSVIAFALDMNYSNLYYRGRGKERKILNISKVDVGWKTTASTRPLMIEAFRSMVEMDEGRVQIKSERLLNELKSFKGGSKPQARNKSKDDAVMAFSIGALFYQIHGASIIGYGENNIEFMNDRMELLAVMTGKAQEIYNEKIEEEGFDFTDETREMELFLPSTRRMAHNKLVNGSKQEVKMRKTFGWLTN